VSTSVGVFAFHDKVNVSDVRRKRDSPDVVSLGTRSSTELFCEG